MAQLKLNVEASREIVKEIKESLFDKLNNKSKLTERNYEMEKEAAEAEKKAHDLNTLKELTIEYSCYPISLDMFTRLNNTFTYHPPFGDQAKRYEVLRNEIKTLAFNIVLLTPPSREQDSALEFLELTMMKANSAIARNENPNSRD